MARTKRVALVEAARSGDDEALAELVRSHLPLVYSIVRRAMPDDPDVDDVVQEVMLRAVSELTALRSADSFRLWLLSITVRQVSTAQQRRAQARNRTIALDAVAALDSWADEAVDPAGTVVVEEELSRQRRQAARAAAWLSDDDRLLASLWWLETAGELSRRDLAQALGLSLAHTGVRVQRMRAHLELSRAVVSAVEARVRCPLLETVLETWDGVPGALWRKRISRHLRECRTCEATTRRLVPAEHLLAGYALLVVPFGLAGALAAKAAAASTAVPWALSAAGGAGAASLAGLGSGAGAAAGAKVGLASRVAQGLGIHPVLSVTAAVTIAGGAITAAVWTMPLQEVPDPPGPPVAAATLAPRPTASAPTPTPAPPRTRPTARSTPPAVSATAAPATTPTPTPTPATVTRTTRAVPVTPAASPTRSAAPAPGDGLVPLGPVAFESSDWRTWWLGSPTSWVGMSATDVGGGPREESVYIAEPGMADPDCVTLRTPDGDYLFEYNGLLNRGPFVGNEGFRLATTLCPRPGALPGTVSLEVRSLPGRFVRHQFNGTVWVDAPDRSPVWAGNSSFHVRPVTE